MSIEDPPPNPVPDPGSILKTARTAAGLSVAQVARRLKLTVRLVRAIEANDRQRCPPAVYLRGYIRNYARLVGVDPEPLLESLLFDTAPEPVEEPPVSGWLGTRLQARTVTLLAAGFAGVALFLSLLVWFWPTDEDATPTAAGAAPSTSDTAPVSPGSTPASEQAWGDDVLVAGENGTVAAEEFAGEMLSGERDVADSTVGPTQIPGAATETGVAGELLRVRRITPSGDDELWLEFSEDCWVGVYNTQAVKLYEALLLRHQNLRLVGSGPFQVRLGYAPGVILEYNGEPIPLGPHTRNNVAALMVGQ